MFTGIIQTTGNVTKLTDGQVVIECSDVIGKLKKGSSVAVDGACLTAVELTNDTFAADFMPETASKTVIGGYKTGSLVNLELPMPADGRFEGHIVSGHVEDMGEIRDIKEDGNAYMLAIRMPDDLKKYIVPKGSITVNGISLTVVDVKDDLFTVSIIPHTWEITNLHSLSVGDKVNLETDILAKHVEKLIKT
jgi:riboflavin synthase